ncbi:MAG: hypothetical protein ETSY1_28375 [Candidatus Entotheonella factor]|uniref:Uncharacterized protein n=1 Tax=Entotheonella factor TaxID=1429438 RepID=W4LE62_ENTF1|nr:MAG: hypothetical protein ETSY1_28375 [Candidatus Entotheonella factor]
MAAEGADETTIVEMHTEERPMFCRVHDLLCLLALFALWGCAAPGSPPLSPGLPPSATPPPEQVETPRVSSDGSAVLITTEGDGADRAEAEKNGLTKAVRDGLRQYMCAEWATDQTVTAYIQRRLDEIAPSYDPLVKRWMLNVNQPRRGGHYMQGTLALDAGVLKRWSDAWLQELSISWTSEQAPLIHRLSLYIVPSSLEEIDLSRDDLKRRQQFMHALENNLSRSGYQIKGDTYRAQAQYQLKLAESIFEESGLIKSMTFTVQILDNSADQALLATASGYAATDVDVTEGIIRKELLESAASKVAAELYCKFLFLALSQPPTEIVFYLPQDLPRNRTQDQLYQGLARIYGEHTPAALESFKTKVHSKHAPVREEQTLSFLMPASYRIPHPQLERELIKLREEIVRTPESVVERASGGTIWHVLNADKPPQSSPRLRFGALMSWP